MLQGWGLLSETIQVNLLQGWGLLSEIDTSTSVTRMGFVVRNRYKYICYKDGVCCQKQIQVHDLLSYELAHSQSKVVNDMVEVWLRPRMHCGYVVY